MKRLGKYYLRQKLKRLKRKVVTHNLESAKTALILYDATEANEDKLAREFAKRLKEEMIKVDGLGFYNKKGKNVERPKDELGYVYFDPTMLNWMRIPSDKQIIKKIAFDYDLLIDLNLENHFPLEYISSLSKAKFKVGSSKSNCAEFCDLTLSLQQEDKQELMKQILVYLNMINHK